MKCIMYVIKLKGIVHSTYNCVFFTPSQVKVKADLLLEGEIKREVSIEKKEVEYED